ncbi:MAG: antibiotic biosynthesis monooxygenase [Chloroflexota bacterium]|jgi:autoinducer 2-degrading protein
MFVAAVHVFVKPEAIDDFKEMIRANHEGSIAEPGCLRFDVVQSVEDPTEFLLWEVYVDEEAAAFHKTTPHYLAFKERMPELKSKERYADRYVGVHVPSPRLER